MAFYFRGQITEKRTRNETVTIGGGSGIRTHESLAALLVFETSALDQLCDPTKKFKAHKVGKL